MEEPKKAVKEIEQEKSANHICFLPPEFMAATGNSMRTMASLDGCKKIIGVFCNPDEVIDDEKLSTLMEMIGLVFGLSYSDKITVQEAYSKLYMEHHTKLWKGIMGQIAATTGMDVDELSPVSVNFTTGEVVKGSVEKGAGKNDG
jgi:hypothetical protein